MRVLFVAGEFPPDVGGLGDYTALLARHLAAAGIEVGVLTRAGAAAKVAGAGVFPLVQGWGSAAWWPVLGAVRQFRPDVVHIQYQAAAFGLAPAAMLLPVVLRRLGPFPAAVTFHDLRPPYLFPKAGPLRRLAVELVYRTSAGAVVTNGVDLACLQGLRFPPGVVRPPLAFIPIGSNIPVVWASPEDLGRLRRDHGVGPDERLVGYFGLLNWSKGAELALGACRQLVDSGLRVRLVLIGGSAGRTDPTNSAYAGFIKRRIEELGLGREVLWTGLLPAEEVSRWLQAVDVMLLPYLDGASLRRGSLVAALVHGRPVVTTRPPDPRAIQPLSGSEHFLLTRPRPEALAGAVREVLSDPVLANRLAERARQAAGFFDWGGIARRHLDFYQVIGAGVAC